ncbi:MAG: VTT domain-containing protein [Rhabdochlamydiaceae bacterium]|nr:VTT domain-containing protein [Candidatus Amphrikana amoebophyrae]
MKKFIPLIIIIALALLVYITKAHTYLSFENLRHHQATLRMWVNDYFWLMILAFFTIYTLIISFSIPIAAYVSIFGGFLFPQPFSTILVVCSATIGATIIFSACKTALGSTLFTKAAPFMKKMEKGFESGSIGYLLFLRFTPIFPFWLVNIAAAFFKVSLTTFIWTTFIGITPGSFVFTQAGRGLESILTSNKPLSLSTILTTDLKIALFALGLFSLIPVVIKFFVKKYRTRN